MFCDLSSGLVSIDSLKTLQCTEYLVEEDLKWQKCYGLLQQILRFSFCGENSNANMLILTNVSKFPICQGANSWLLAFHV